jgi:xanthine dehydrogenase YagS FAD-binding subunit
VSVADSTVTDVRLALGGVAHKPWRAFEAERHLRHSPATLEQLQLAVDAELAASRSYVYNHFKLELARRTIISVMSELMGLRGLR